jgi:hypothetical protein
MRHTHIVLASLRKYVLEVMETGTWAYYQDTFLPERT